MAKVKNRVNENLDMESSEIEIIGKNSASDNIFENPGNPVPTQKVEKEENKQIKDNAKLSKSAKDNPENDINHAMDRVDEILLQKEMKKLYKSIDLKGDDLFGDVKKKKKSAKKKEKDFFKSFKKLKGSKDIFRNIDKTFLQEEVTKVEDTSSDKSSLSKKLSKTGLAFGAGSLVGIGSAVIYSKLKRLHVW